MGFLIILIRPCLAEIYWLRQRPITTDKEPLLIDDGTLVSPICPHDTVSLSAHYQSSSHSESRAATGPCVVTGPGQAGQCGPPPPPGVLGLVKTSGWRERGATDIMMVIATLGTRGFITRAAAERKIAQSWNSIKMWIIAILCFYCFLMVYSTNQLWISDFLSRVHHAHSRFVTCCN